MISETYYWSATTKLFDQSDWTDANGSHIHPFDSDVLFVHCFTIPEFYLNSYQASFAPLMYRFPSDRERGYIRRRHSSGCAVALKPISPYHIFAWRTYDCHGRIVWTEDIIIHMYRKSLHIYQWIILKNVSMYDVLADFANPFILQSVSKQKNH